MNYNKIDEENKENMPILKTKQYYTSIISFIVIFIFFSFFFWQTKTPATEAQGFTNTLFPHIKTWGMFVGNSVPLNETLWGGSHFDVMGGNMFSSDDLYQINPNIEFCAYENPSEISDGSFSYMEDWAADNGYNMEDQFVHYTEDVTGQIWNTNVPGYRDSCYLSNSNCNPPATATSLEQARVLGTYSLCPNCRMQNLENPQTYLYRIYEQSSIWQLWPQKYNPSCIYFDAISIFDYILTKQHIDKTDVYAGITMDYNHPRMTSLFQWPLDYISSVQSQFNISMLPIANASATMYLVEEPWKSRFINYYDWVFVEDWLDYNTVSYEASYSSAIAEMTRQSMAGEKRLLRGNETYSQASDRAKIFLLGSYYLVNNENTYFNYKKIWNEPEGYDLPYNQWFNAISYNIGTPVNNGAEQSDFDGNLNTSEHYEWATGADPSNPSKTYHILARQYSNALVLVKFRPSGSSWAASTTHDLGGTYRPLNVDGTLGDPITQVTLRNNEAAILIPVDTTAPEAVDDLSAS